MNKAQKEVQQVQLNGEQKTIKQLQRIYDQARKDCEQRIRELSSRTDMENLQSIIYQKQYQEALKKQLDSIIDNLQSEEFVSVADYLQKSYQNGYVGVMYDLHRQGIPIIMPINQEQIVKALETDSKLSESLYQRLGEDTAYLKRSIRAELSRGIANGSSWNEMAAQITKGMNSPYNKAYNNAIRIARTEGHRIQQRSALDAQYAAKEKGADILKQWDSTLDNKTRPHHRRLDGQIRELDEPFEVDGLKADAPGHFGKASEDCNCRCCLLQRARWALDEDELNELRERAAYFGLDKTKDFEEFESKYLDATKSIEKSGANDTIKETNDKGKSDVHTVGKIDRNIYKCITDNIVTDEVIITDERIKHIIERHPNDYERFYNYIQEIIRNPDFIIEANKPNTAVVLKEIEERGEKFKLVLRIKVQGDPEEYKNSIMTFWRIGETTWRKTLKNKKILYKRE